MTFSRMSLKEFKREYRSLEPLPSEKKSKYNNKPVEIDGHRFPSQSEGRRYLQLKDRLNKGEIRNLQLQVPFECIVNGRKICVYKADFVYAEDGMKVIEDNKGCKTAVYQLKKKLVEACHNVVIREVRA